MLDLLDGSGQPTSLMDRVALHADVDPSKTAMRWVSGKDGHAETLDYGGMHRAALILAAQIEGSVVDVPVGIACASPLNAAVGVLACLASGLACEVLPSPAEVRGTDTFSSDPQRACSTDQVLSDRVIGGAGWRQVAFGKSEFNLFARPKKTPSFARSLTDIAFIQSTSGTTGNPKTVLVSHRNIEAACEQAAEAYGLTAEDRFVSWTPMHYSMGIVNALLLPLTLGATSTLVASRGFAEDPMAWLRAVQRYRGTYSSAPEFGYSRCVDRIGPELAAGLDLSSWRVARVAAGPLWSEVLDGFVERFGPSGFRAEAFCPSYGLTEATLFVSGTRPGEPYPPRAALSSWSQNEVVAAGRPMPGTSITIVDPETGSTCAPGAVGEIRVSGPQVAMVVGEDESNRSAQERSAAAAVSLVTGDLGVFEDGMLWVVGRRRDIVKIRGVTHSLSSIDHEIAKAAAELGVRRWCALAGGGLRSEQLWVAAEPGDDLAPDEVVRRIARFIPAVTGVRAHRIVLVGPGELPVTDSGKPRRSECVRQLLADSMTTLCSWPESRARVER
ncbi:AMP-binding protein [Glycomyces tritici]|uniref:AMP-binding protein n=1 Tax=Glycomyces tritici TaxID=2665176 RepID=A0ABT7YX19_9ACTN|nr:AMP-binding protein [Glycomyces tritici]MDN3243181.1 AMP-binding protein [Glycomyces tritici]